MKDNMKIDMDLNNPVLDEVSPYDSEYPILLLAKGFKNNLEQAQKLAQKIYTAVSKESPILTQIKQSTIKGYRYVVDASDSTLKALDAGKIKLTVEKSGKTFAQIREANGQYGAKLPIKKEFFKKGIDPVQMANALQMKALQEQVQEIANQISIIDSNVKEVLQGQQNDRIGLYYSGMTLYLESQNIIDADMKKALTIQSLRALSESTYQLILNMKTDIDYLVDGKYKLAKGKNVELIDSHIYSINKSFEFIHQATLLRAGIYCNQGELAAMSTVFDEYSHFIESTVVNNANQLAEFDKTDDGTDCGVWKSRSKLKLTTNDLTQQLSMPNKTLYLGISEAIE